MESINDLGTYLMTQWWGVIILSSLGTGLFILVGNILGRTNKGAKWLWIYYNEGYKFTIKAMSESQHYYENIKLLYHQFVFLSLMLIIIITGMVVISDVLDEDTTGVMFILLIPFLILLFYVTRYNEMLRTVNTTKWKEEMTEKYKDKYGEKE